MSLDAERLCQLLKAPEIPAKLQQEKSRQCGGKLRSFVAERDSKNKDGQCAKQECEGTR